MKNNKVKELLENGTLDELFEYLMVSQNLEEDGPYNDTVTDELEEANEAFREAAEQDAISQTADEMPLENRPLLDRVIYHFLRDCEEAHKLPTYEQAKTIELLDELVQKYN